jgi:hypothetical protein
VSIYDYNVTVDNVLDRIPMNTSQIGPSTEPIDTGDVEDAIDGAASDVSGAIERNGIDGSDLSDEAHRQLEKVVRDGAAAEIMRRTGHVDSSTYDSLETDYDEAANKYADSSHLDRDDGGGRVESSVGGDNRIPDEQRSPFRGTDWEM